MSITGTARLSKGFYLYMPTDAQDTHIMKAHLRKHEVFHNIASALENVVFNNSLGDRKRWSQHLVETSFQRFERTGMRKNRKGNPLMLAGDAKSSSSNEGAFGNPREIAREARSTDPGSTYPQHMKGYRRKTEAGNETTLKENGPYSRSMPAKRRKHAPKPATRGWKNIPLLIERFRRLWKTLKTWNPFENRCGKISKHAFSDCSKP